MTGRARRRSPGEVLLGSLASVTALRPGDAVVFRLAPLPAVDMEQVSDFVCGWFAAHCPGVHPLVVAGEVDITVVRAAARPPGPDGDDWRP